MRGILFLQAAVLALITVLFVHFGIDRGFFWTIWWWDIPMHILGGLWVALASYWLLRIAGIRVGTGGLILSALTVGALWEVFEYSLGIGGSPFMSYWVDTCKDVANDVIGGAVGAYIVRLFRV